MGYEAGARERLRQVRRRVADASRRRQAEGVRLPPHASRAAGRQAGREHRVQPGDRQPQPDHPVAGAAGLQVGRSAQEDRRRGQRRRREAEAAQDARRVPQPHDGLQSHRRRVLVEPVRGSDRKDVVLQFDTGNASEKEGVTPQELIRATPAARSRCTSSRSRRRTRTPTSAPTNSMAGDHDGRRNGRRHRVVHHRVPRRKACRRSRR